MGPGRESRTQQLALLRNATRTAGVVRLWHSCQACIFVEMSYFISPAWRQAVFLLFFFLAMGTAQAQRLQYGEGFTENGDLKAAGKSFTYAGQPKPLAVKLQTRGLVPSDTLFLIVKDIKGVAGRY